MSFTQSHLTKAIISCVVSWSLVLLLIPFVSSDESVPFAVLSFVAFFAVLLTFAAIVIAFTRFSARIPKSEAYAYGVPAKILASLLVATVVLSTGTAIKSLWYSPFGDHYGDRFVYENVATGAGYMGIILTLLLSALQKDIYWITRKDTVRLDERLLQERRQVFETSYKLGAFLVLVAVFWLNSKLWQVPAIMANNHETIPGHLFLIGINLATTLFALPLIVAAWKKRVR